MEKIQPYPGYQPPTAEQQKSMERSNGIYDRNFEKKGDIGGHAITDYYDKLTGRTFMTPSTNYQPKNEKRFQRVSRTDRDSTIAELGREQHGPSGRERLAEKMKNRPDGGYQGKKAQAFKDKYSSRIKNQVKRRRKNKRQGGSAGGGSGPKYGGTQYFS